MYCVDRVVRHYGTVWRTLWSCSVLGAYGCVLSVLSASVGLLWEVIMVSVCIDRHCGATLGGYNGV